MAEVKMQGKCTLCEGWHPVVVRSGRVRDGGKGVGLVQDFQTYFWCDRHLMKYRPLEVSRDRHA